MIEGEYYGGVDFVFVLLFGYVGGVGGVEGVYVVGEGLCMSL